MPLHYHLLDVFTDVPFGGNQLAVFPDATDIDPALMPRIARELNLSETVFLLPATLPGALRRLRIFTPGMELPFAGHPTIGTGHLLVDLGIAPAPNPDIGFVLEEAVGPVPVVARRRGDGSLFVQLTTARVPEQGPPPPDAAVLAALLGLDPADLVSGDDVPMAVSAGVPFLFVPVSGRSALARVQLDLGRWRTVLADWWAPHVMIYCRDPGDPAADFRVRMFAPAMGIVEDPATGGGAAAMAGYLAWRSGRSDGRLGWTVEQGIEMGRPSRLEIEVEMAAGRIVTVRVGGTAVRMGEGTLRLPGAARS